MNDERLNIDCNDGYDWSANDMDEPDEESDGDLYELRRFASLSKNHFYALMSLIYWFACSILVFTAVFVLSGLKHFLPGIPYNIDLTKPSLSNSGLVLFGWMSVNGAWILFAETRLNIADKRIRRLKIRKREKGASRNVSLLIDLLIDITYMSLSRGSGEMAIVQLLRNQLFSLSREDEVTLSPQRRKFLHALVSRNEWSKPTSHRNYYRARVQQELPPAVVYALGFIGDRSSIRVLEKVAKTIEYPELRQSALNSIEQIRERLKYGPEQMLRASRLPEQPDTLLRAAVAAQDAYSDPDELLRANQTGEADMSTQQASRYLSDEARKQEEMRLRNHP